MNKLTQEQVSELSDNALDVGLADFLGRDYFISSDGSIWRKDIVPSERISYCNNWNDLMPLVLEHDIYHAPPYEKGGKYQATQWVKDSEDIWLEVSNLNLKRAYAECLFLVLQEIANNGN